MSILFKRIYLVPLIIFGGAGAADHSNRSLVAAPIEVSRAQFADAREPAETVLRFRGTADRWPWFRVDGVAAGARIDGITARFRAHRDLLVQFRVDGAPKTATIAIPDASEVGFDGGQLLFFGRSPDGWDETRVVRELRIRGPRASETLMPGLAAAGILGVATALPAWSWPMAIVIPVATYIARDSCVRWLSSEWTGALWTEAYDLSDSTLP